MSEYYNEAQFLGVYYCQPSHVLYEEEEALCAVIVHPKRLAVGSVECGIDAAFTCLRMSDFDAEREKIVRENDESNRVGRKICGDEYETETVDDYLLLLENVESQMKAHLADPQSAYSYFNAMDSFTQAVEIWKTGIDYDPLAREKYTIQDTFYDDGFCMGGFGAGLQSAASRESAQQRIEETRQFYKARGVNLIP